MFQLFLSQLKEWAAWIKFFKKKGVHPFVSDNSQYEELAPSKIKRKNRKNRG